MNDSNLPLNPTLWRTCRVLAGPTRLQLLRLVLATPGLCVSRLADEAGIKLSLASQELRRLQSRGLLRAERRHNQVRYLPAADPQVTGAQALLDALTASFDRFPPTRDALILKWAAGLSHPRRVAILQELLQGSRTPSSLASRLHIPLRTVYRHVTILEENLWLRCRHGACRVRRTAHPFARCLADRARQSPPT